MTENQYKAKLEEIDRFRKFRSRARALMNCSKEYTLFKHSYSHVAISLHYCEEKEEDGFPKEIDKFSTSVYLTQDENADFIRRYVKEKLGVQW